MSSHKIGWHLHNTRPMVGSDWAIIEAVPPMAVLNIPGGATPEDIARILEISPGCHVFIRPYFRPSDNDWEREKYIRAVESMVREGHWQRVIPEGQRHLQLFNEPNMPHTAPVGHPDDQWEGFGPTEAAMKSFNNWFVNGYERIKAIDPTWKIGFTPLTIGNRDCYFATDEQNVPYYMHGPEAAKDDAMARDVAAAILSGPCYEALMRADEYLAHIYCSTDPEVTIFAPWYGLRFLQYARYLPRPVDIWINECGIGAPPSSWGVWYDMLDDFPQVKGTCIWRLGVEIRSVDDPQVQYLKRYLASRPSQPEPEPPPPEPEPEPEPTDVEGQIRNKAWNLSGVDFNPAAAFYLEAQRRGLGRPVTQEDRLTIGDTVWALQGYDGGILYTEEGNWANIQLLAWL